MLTSAGVVGATVVRAGKAGLDKWSQIQAMDDAELEERLYGRPKHASRPRPDCAHIHAERSKPGVTLRCLGLPVREPALRRVPTERLMAVRSAGPLGRWVLSRRLGGRRHAVADG